VRIQNTRHTKSASFSRTLLRAAGGQDAAESERGRVRVATHVEMLGNGLTEVIINIALFWVVVLFFLVVRELVGRVAALF
jgi:uncharacterized protein HemY